MPTEDSPNFRLEAHLRCAWASTSPLFLWSHVPAPQLSAQNLFHRDKPKASPEKVRNAFTDEKETDCGKIKRKGFLLKNLNLVHFLGGFLVRTKCLTKFAHS